MTGAITVANSAELDFETTPSFTLTVTASDGSLSDTAAITVNLNNLNDNAPAIADATVAIDENSANGSAVVNVSDSFTGTDFDRDGEVITYSITAGNTGGAFTIDGVTGAITVANSAALDFETTPSFALTVTASDGTLSDTAAITVNLDNLNDNAPNIIDATVAIDENSANATAVTNVSDSFTGSDFDRDAQAITYSITAGNTDGAFTIDAATGAITVANSAALDFETTPSFTLTVTASDGSLSDTAAITVNLNNLNDNAPAIADATVAIDENSANATAVINVSDSFTGTDFDRDAQAITYSITGGNALGGFAINAATGAITVANSAALDFETMPSFSLTVTASDGTLSDTAAITVNLNNLNDNAPAIADATVAIDENTANATAVTNVSDIFTGTDFDRDGTAITYSITGGNALGGFAINAATGAITVANSATLDFETTPSFTLTVTGSDGTLSDTAAITVNLNNLNDNAPNIIDATVVIDENSANTTAVTNVSDSFTGTDFDRDAQAITYSITAGNTGGAFAIDAATGAITVANSGALDFETTPSFTLTVTASDGSLSDTAAITVNLDNLNDNAPAIADATVAIDENSANATAVTNVSDSFTGTDFDRDGTAITYSITAGNTGGAFTVNASTGAITVANSTALDFEANPSFTLTVTASDGTLSDTAAITVNLNNLNDNAPVVADVTVAIDENSANTTAVTNVSDSFTGSDFDRDGQAITYSITGGNTGGAFTIDAATGAIAVANSAALDFESTPSFTLTVTASDGTLSDTAAITVNLNNLDDNAPAIADATVVIDENSANATAVTNVSDSFTGTDFDRDGTAITYGITAGNTGGAFAINAATGAITVANSAALDFETTPSFTLTVTASDGTLSDTAAITVNLNNLNDNAPNVIDATVAIDENSANATAVTNISDSFTGSDFDRDAQAITYSITAGNTGGAFAIDSATGAITVANSAALDFETTPSFTLTVTASDGTLSDTAAITVNLNNLNDNAPNIVDATVAIDENSANATAVTNVSDSFTGTDFDRDAQAITYSITAGNTGGAFAIDAVTGAITVANSAALDFEATPSFTLTVSASDGSLSDTAAITVNLNNLNDNAPNIVDATVAIDENSANSTAVTNISDSFTGTDFDRDGQAITYSITAGDTGGAFTIDASTGAITVANSAALDFETTPSFTLTVTASDGTLSDTAAITVNLNNLNDNAPAIADATVALDENSANATAVTNVSDSFTGTDFDRDAQAITYSITAGNTAGAFTIDSATGAITVANSTALDFETTPSFTLTVTASDGTLSDTAAITVNLNNLNDNAPAIADATVAIDENSANATAVANVSDSFTGTDLDRDGQAITYSITAGNTGGAFAIDSATGAITVANTAALDFETTPSFTLTVTASDGSLSDTAAITVNLNNLNDNAPAIADATVAIDENSANATAVTNISDSFTGTDFDRDGQAITYSISAGNTGGAFAIDAATGAITVANSAALDFETTPSFTLTVTASDGSLSDTAAITVNLNNLNDNAPNIIDATVAIDENSANATAVINVSDSFTGTDFDRDAQAITYSITAGNTGGAFTIDAATGAITVVNSTALDFETNPSFTLTLTASDGTLSDTAAIAVNLNNLNDNAPNIVDATVAIDENSANATAVINLSDSFTGTDFDRDAQAITYSITGGNTSGAFAIDAATGAITVANGAALDFQTNPSFTLTVTASDGTLSDTATITVNVNNGNAAPVITSDGGGATAAVNVAENSTAVTTTTATDADLPGQTLAYSISGGTDAARFSIDSSTGVLSFIAAPNFEAPADTNADNVYDVTVQVSDGSLVDSQALGVTVVNANEAPTALTPALANADENAAAATLVATVSASDPDAGELFSFSLLQDGAGRFTMDPSSGRIVVAPGAVLDFETQAGFDLLVRVTDAGGLSYQQLLRIDLRDLPEAGAPPPPPAPAPPASAPNPAPAAPPPAPVGAAPLPVAPALAGLPPTPAASAPAPAAAPGGSNLAAPSASDPSTTGTPGLGAPVEVSDPRRPGSEQPQPINLRLRNTAEGLVASISFDALHGAEALQMVVTAWDEAARGSIGDALRNALLTYRSASVEADTGNTQHPGDAARAPGTMGEMMQDPVRIASATFTAGFIWWLTRSGGLLTTMLMGVPAWRHVDLLPVLARTTDDDDADGAPDPASPPRRGSAKAPARDYEDSAVAELFGGADSAGAGGSRSGARAS